MGESHLVCADEQPYGGATWPPLGRVVEGPMEPAYGAESGETSAEKSGEIVKPPLIPAQKTGGVSNLKQFVKGVSGNPKGRPRKQVEDEVQEAVDTGASPKRIEEVFDVLYNHVMQYGGYKAAEAYLKLALPYQLGNPNQRIIHQDDAFNQILEAMRAKRQGE